MRAVIGISTIRDRIIATKDSIKPNPMKTFEIINAATPIATVSA